MTARRAGRAVVPLIAAAALAFSACGGGDETAAPATKQDLTAGLSGQKQDAAAAIEAYLAAFASGDPDQICPLTSRTETALERCKDALPEFHPPNEQPPYELQTITIHGPRADAKIVQKNGQGKPVFFQLQDVDGGWKIVVATLQG